MEVMIRGDVLYRKHKDGTQDVIHVPLPPSKESKRKERINKVLSKMTKAVRVIYQHEYDEFATYEITPTPSVRNNQAYVLAKVIAGFYKLPKERKTWGSPIKDSLIKEKSQYRMNFRIVMQANDIAFYLLLPRERAGEILRKAEAIYDSKITIKEVDSLPSLDPERLYCSELRYKKHDIFSLSTDKDNNYPLPSLLGTVRTLEGDDIAVFDAMIEPYSRMDWFKEAEEAHKQLKDGVIPDNRASSKLLRFVNSMFVRARNELLDLTRFTKEQKEVARIWKEQGGQSKEVAFLRDNMTPSTKKKQDEEIVKTYLRIAVQSDSPERGRDASINLANAWKDLSADNELERVDVPKSWNKRYWNGIENRKNTYVSFTPPKMSIHEAGKLIQLPGKNLLEEFPMIRHKSITEVTLPEELTQENIKTLKVGYVTERGKKKLARIPLEEYTLHPKDGEPVKVALKKVYDALCLSTFAQGKQGSGKSEGYGVRMAYDMIMAGFTSIVTDTADGEVLKKLLDSLPADYPESKIHIIDLDNKAYPIPLDWSDVYGRKFNVAEEDEELQALEISERLTQRFIGFIDGLKDGDEKFSDRMRQYITSALRAITTMKSWSFLDLELCLTSPVYREELLEKDEVKKQPDVVRDLLLLQDKTLEGKDRTIVDPIIARLRELSSTQFMTNLFFQLPKLDVNGEPVLNIRKIMDNPEGGYGHIVLIKATSDAWQEAQAILLGFMEDKLNFNAFSRVDIPQSERKPVLKWLDEPHKVIKTIERQLSGTSVEFRKYRVKNLFTGHSIGQMGKATNALMDGGAQITSYKTERDTELKRFSHMFKPYDDEKILYDALSVQHTAINKVKLPSGKDCPAFIAEMMPPPKIVKDRDYMWTECSKRYGRPWKEVSNSINERRSSYQEKDEAWMEANKKKKK